MQRRLVPISKYNEYRDLFYMIVMGNLIVYIFIYDLLRSLVLSRPFDIISLFTIYSIHIISILFFAIYTNLSVSFYGLSMRHIGSSVKIATLISLKFIALVVVIKILVITFVPAMKYIPLFSGVLMAPLKLPDHLNNLQTLPMELTFRWNYLLVYIIFAAIQEFAIRGFIQSNLAVFLTIKHRHMWALIFANLVFACYHAFISPWFGVISFIPGLIFGWIYYKTRSLAACIVSHSIIGGFILYVLGLTGLW